MAKVLVVDDDAMYRGLIVEALELEGNDVHEAHSTTSALRVLNSDPHFDVILCDLQMDGLDGFELLKTLKAQFPRIPVVVMSAHSADGGIGERARSYASQYLSKPFSMVRLLSIIQTTTHLPAKRM
jgi:two-component system, response regulator FlrC